MKEEDYVVFTLLPDRCKVRHMTTIHNSNHKTKTSTQERNIIRIAAEARRGENVTKPMSVKKAIAYLKALALTETPN